VALVGDPSDELPGLPGVGPATAARWLQRFGGLDALLARLEEVEPARLRALLGERAEQLRLNERLARLRDDVALPPGPRHLPLTGEALARLRGLFERLEFRSLLPRLERLAPTA
jgi:DNA polymerase-1